MTPDKQALRYHMAELRHRMNLWDPLHLIASGAPPDEYDCLTGPLARLLHEGRTVEEIAAYLERELHDHFGAAPAPGASRLFAEEILT